MNALVAAAVLAFTAETFDGGTLPDGGFEPVVLDVNHAALWLNTPDGGVSDAPVLVRGGVWEDDRTAMLTGKSEARGTGERTVGPDIDTRTLLLVGATLFLIGAGTGIALGWVAHGR